jgi:hypothetical protein
LGKKLIHSTACTLTKLKIHYRVKSKGICMTKQFLFFSLLSMPALAAEDMVALANSARGAALSQLSSAASKSRDTTYRNMYDRLSRATIKNGVLCSSLGDPAAYANPASGTIQVCPALKTWLRYGTAGIAHTLIHEAAHLAGIFNECDADRATHEVQRLSGSRRIPGSYCLEQR